MYISIIIIFTSIIFSPKPKNEKDCRVDPHVCEPSDVHFFDIKAGREDARACNAMRDFATPYGVYSH